MPSLQHLDLRLRGAIQYQGDLEVTRPDPVQPDDIPVQASSHMRAIVPASRPGASAAIRS